MRSRLVEVPGTFIEYRFKDGAFSGELVRTHFELWPVEPSPDAWGLSCRKCGLPFAREDVRDGYEVSKHTSCSRCGGMADRELWLTRSSAGLVGGEHALVTGRDWWHCSPNDQLSASTVNARPLHIGSRDAALHRALNHGGKRGDVLFLYRVTLGASPIVLPDVIVEQWDVGVEEYFAEHEPRLGEVSRYVNYNEAPGDISLLVNGCVSQMSIAQVFHLQQPSDSKPVLFEGRP